jgi:hypothetical protein
MYFTPSILLAITVPEGIPACLIGGGKVYLRGAREGICRILSQLLAFSLFFAWILIIERLYSLDGKLKELNLQVKES